MSESELRLLHPARTCGTPGCNVVIEARLSKAGKQNEGLEQSDGFICSAIFECVCGWKRTEPLHSGVAVTTGWTTSVSPCRRKNDVQPR